MKHPKLYLDYPASRPDLQIHCLRCQTLLVVYGFSCYVPPATGKRKSKRGSFVIEFAEVVPGAFKLVLPDFQSVDSNLPGLVWMLLDVLLGLDELGKKKI